MNPARFSLVVALLVCASKLHAQASRPGPNRQLPPVMKELPPADRAELDKGIADLASHIEALKREPPKAPLLPDIQIYHNALRYPLAYNEIIEMPRARAALAEGLRRAQALRYGNPDWIHKTGPRGYISRIDNSVQPYLLIVPAQYTPGESTPRPLDFFCHGRSENLTELNFLSNRLPEPPADHFLVHLYGRFCNANKFAGEIDLLETLESMKARHRIDENRVVVTGFSMGGAACWQFAVHYTDLFAAASPGAGFAESRQFLRIRDLSSVPWYEQKLWHLYDCTDYAANLSNLPTIAYSGELDGQKQASDVMLAAMEAEGLTLERLIGPQTRHEYHKETKQEIDRRLAAYAQRARNSMPAKIRLTTWTLRYNRMHWVTIDAMEKHWDRARVDAEIVADRIAVKTANVAALTIQFPQDKASFKPGMTPVLTIDSSRIEAPVVAGAPWTARLQKEGTAWKLVSSPDASLRKRHALQGPIDDAFMDRFVFVIPGGKSKNEKFEQWVSAESKRAIAHWQKQFRGEAIVKRDGEVTQADIAASNLVLWGDAQSNTVLARLADKLPIAWTDSAIAAGASKFPSSDHALAMIHPNPLNPNRYIVLNSGFTFRDFDYLNNARQIPKLPDYAIFDLNVPPDARYPGKIVKAGFFNEQWKLQPDDGF